MKKTTASFLLMGVTALTMAALWLWPVERWVTVKTVRVSLGSVEKSVSVTGSAARKGEYISAHPRGGVVAKVYVQEGQSVAAGQPLYRLEDAVHQAALQKAMQALQHARQSAQAWEEQVAAAFGQEGQALAAEGLAVYGGSQQDLAAQAKALEEEIQALTQRAYRDGQVLKLLAREGELLLPGSPGAVLCGEEAEVRAEVNARDAQQIREGMRARITQNGVPLGEAVVERVGILRPNQQGIPYAQVVFSPLDGLSVPVGAQVEVDVLLAARSGVPVVPVEALTREDAVFQVYGDRAWELDVVVNLWDGTWAAVEGILPGTEVVLSPGDSLRDGVRLKVVKP